MKSLRSPFALVLSGTPLENRLDDVFSVVEFIDDRRLGPAFRFYKRHRVTDERGKVLGYKDLDLLRESLKPVLLRRTRSAVMKDLPPRTTEIVRIAPTAEQLDIDQAQMRIVSSIVSRKYISEMDLLRLQKALLLARMNANSTYLVDKRAPGYSSKLERLARRSRVADAGGQLLTAAFTLLGEMIPQRAATNGAAQMASELKARLDECLERDERGRPRAYRYVAERSRAGESGPDSGLAADGESSLTSHQLRCTERHRS